MAPPNWLRRAAGGVGRAVQAIPGKIAGPVNPELAGLLGPELLADSRRDGLLGFAAAMHQAGTPGAEQQGGIAGALMQGRQAAQQSLQGGFQQKAGLEQYANAKQDRAFELGQREQQTTLARRRAEIMGKYQIPPNAPQDVVNEALRRMYAEFVSAGDTEMVGKMSSIIPSLQGKPPEWRNAGGHDVLYDPQTGREIQRVPRTPTPRDPNTPDHAATINQQRMFAREQQLADDYNKDTAPTRDMAQKVAGAIAEAPAAKAGDGIAQVNLLYAFVSSMDPGTAVREGEIGLVRGAGSLVQQAQGYLARYTQGQAVTVPPAMVDQMEKLMRRRLAGSQRYVKSRSDYYRKRGERWGVDPSSFPELEVALPDGAVAAPATGKVKGKIGGIR